jgi:hypothetical protein
MAVDSFSVRTVLVNYNNCFCKINSKMLHNPRCFQRSLYFLVLFFLLFCFISPAQAAKKYALLIGVADYSAVPGLYSLDGPLNDIDLIREVLLQKHLGFQEEDIVVLQDSRATHTGIEKAMHALAARVGKEDGGMVYIHYSGHGSQTKNLHPEEREEFDQTWVSYGARTAHYKGIDQWDILDDEIHEWLSLISDQADQVILVSDSCHSGSVTRGQSLVKTRAAKRDKREHPLGKKKFRNDIEKNGVFIGAAADTEPAGEYIPDDTPYGLFTWFWAGTLESAQSGDTWHDLLWKTRIQVQGERGQQTPQISGSLSDGTVFAGAVGARQNHYPVLEVNNDQQTATIKHGIITGASVGSIYELYDPDRNSKNSAILELTSCTPFNCTGRIVSGSLKAADFMTEKQHAYTIDPVALSIDGDFAEAGDRVVKELRASFSADPIPGYLLVGAADPRTMTLYVSRSVHRKDGSSDVQTGEVLSLSSPDAEPEVWVLNSTNQPWHDDLMINYQDPVKSWAKISETLQKIARAKEIKRLSSISPPELKVEVSTWSAVSSCIPGTDCLKDRQGYFRKGRTFPLATIEEQGLRKGDSLTFAVSNSGEDDTYLYILNIGPDDGIVILFPRRANSNDEEARLLHGGKSMIDTRRVGRLVLSSGSETIKIIASAEPISVSYFAQTSYTSRGKLKAGRGTTRGSTNPFNRLIAAAVGGKTRGEQVMAEPVSGKWGTLQMSVNVLSE